jgi:hypothetical protein
MWQCVLKYYNVCLDLVVTVCLKILQCISKSCCDSVFENITMHVYILLLQCAVTIIIYKGNVENCLDGVLT